MKFKTLFIINILILAMYGCLKDDISNDTSKIVFAEQSITLENCIIDFGKRDGIQRAPFLFLESMNTDNFFLAEDREFLLFNHHNIDSVRMIRSNPNFANMITPTGAVEITNYSATFHFKNGHIETFRVLSKVRADVFTWIPDISKSLLSAGVTENILKFTRIRTSVYKRLPYRGNSINLWNWKLSTKTSNTYITADTLLLYPETKASNQWQPVQVY